MWDVRQHPRVYQAFRELWGTPRLTVSIDTADMKPPRRADLEGWGAPLRLHMDLDDAFLAAGPLAPPRVSEDGGGALWNRARCAQGVLQLAETTADGGGFRCLPGFHRRAQPPAPLPHLWPLAEGRRSRAGWEEWQCRFPGQNPNEWLAPEVIEENLASGEWGEILDVGGGPGDLIIWVNECTDCASFAQGLLPADSTVPGRIRSCRTATASTPRSSRDSRSTSTCGRTGRSSPATAAAPTSPQTWSGGCGCGRSGCRAGATTGRHPRRRTRGRGRSCGQASRRGSRRSGGGCSARTAGASDGIRTSLCKPAGFALL